MNEIKRKNFDANVLTQIIRSTITANNRYLLTDSSLEGVLKKKNIQFSHFIFPTTIDEDGAVGVDHEKISLADESINEEPITDTTSDLPLLASGINPDNFLSIESNNRYIYINKHQGTSIKVFKQTSSYEENKNYIFADKRLNALYKSPHFYGGIYKNMLCMVRMNLSWK